MVFPSEKDVSAMAKQTTYASSIPATEPTNLEERLKHHPELKAKIETLLSVVENAQGDLEKANEAEQRVIEEIRQLGQAALQGWANWQNQVQSERFIKDNPKGHRTRQKNSTVTVGLEPLKS
jgi:hypothetical protein